MRRRLICGAAIMLGLLPLTRAQETTIGNTFREAWKAWGRGDDTRTERLLREGVSQAASAATEDPRLRGAAEIGLMTLNFGAEYNDPSRHAAWLDSLDMGRAWPRLRITASIGKVRAAAVRADMDELVKATEAAGIVRDFVLAGPFPNERGGGFSQSFGPEGAFDPTARFDGKDRKVGWRPAGMRPTDGRLEFATLVEPSRQAIVFAAFDLEVDEAVDALFWIGVGGGYKLFVNRAECASEDVLRQFEPAQRAVAVHLAAGKNLVVLEVAGQDDPPTLQVAVTDGSGRAIPGMRTSASIEDLVQASRTESKTPELVAPVEAMDLLGEALGASPDAAIAIDFGMLRFRLRSDKAERQQTASLLERVASVAERPAAHLSYLIGATLDIPTRIRAERDDNRRRRYFESALASDPEFVPALEQLALHYQSTLPMASRVEELARRWLAVDPNATPALLLLAQIAEHRDDDIAAIERLLDAIALGDGDDQALAWVIAQHGFIDFPRISKLLDAAFARRPGSFAVRSLQERRLDEFHRDDELRAHLERNLVLDPQRLATHRRLASIAEGHDDLEAAAGWIDAALEVAPDDPGLLMAAAGFARRRGDDSAAIAHLDHLIEVRPSDRSARRYREFLDADNQPFEDRFPFDVAATVSSAPSFEDNAANDSHRYLLHETIVNVNPNGTTQSFHRDVVQVLNDAGVAAFDRYPAGGRGMSTRVKTARVHRRDGSTAEADIGGGFGFFGGIDLPRLVPGDVIEVAWRSDETAQSFFGNYVGIRETFEPRTLAATVLSRLTVLLPKGRKFIVRSMNGAPEPTRPESAGDVDAYVWELRDLARIEPEPAMPPLHETMPGIEVSSYADWNEFTAWWWNLIKEQYVVTDEMRAKVKELTAGKTSTMEKVRAIYDFVSTDIRYVAWEFGVHGYKPYKANVIFERRFGDCKDKAILINTLLAELGIPSYPVLISLEEQRPREDLSVALVEHFNHCIAYLPKGEDHDAYFLDGTAVYHEMELVPGGDRDAEVVVVEDGKASRKRTPGIDPTKNVLELGGRIRVNVDGSAAAELEASFGGLNAPDFRAIFETESSHQLRLEEYLGAWFGKVKIESFEVKGAGTTTVTPELSCKTRIDGIAKGSDDGFSIPLAQMRSRLSSLVSRDSRRFDIVLGPNRGERSKILWMPPDGWLFAERPNDVVIDSPLGHFRLETKVKDGGLEVVREFWLKTRRISVADYAAFREFCQRIDEAESESIRMRRAER